MPRSNAAEKLLTAYPANVQEIAMSAREMLQVALPGITETVDESAKMLAYSYGPGYKGLVCTLIMSKAGVKLGVAFGAGLPDPKRLMTGAGKVHRHVQLSSVDDLEQPGLKQLLKVALAAWRKRTGEALPARRVQA